ncbi:2-oxoglutarate dehydrogenase complex dihydrolipoyllysine-residue succinyltransferase [Aquicella lusitana]|uniref:Dihydrolipoyllysine-residue succinyltransferase component of 2-oxoglutarate dehydrogenase complex n=1 Tax=Aquicella lusitana TaxID=254246 RepID=A0A370GGD8_9COXI|nr:2-oxoglutarate dehydrogenase complex dihydrolipoyllysine-residue succinyltransferase [Aquicella lusitana]RDI42731.1 2-oxoglutarate dehydrogenase E2 component [Aquicella lusitana]VVC73414.1 Dihydrolipoyllysine-residue succinyltransferase component of 2-oxoglutarate dehydrogenase complex [Aquicella lusitana]
MSIEIKVPQLPESISDATVSTWHKKEGDSVSRDENIVDLETDKVMLEVPAPVDGVIKKIVKQTGSTVQAQEILAIIEEGASARAEPKEVKEEKKEAAPKKAEAYASSAPQKMPPAGPSARRAAAEHDVDVSRVEGTGKGGRITKENVMSAISSQTLGLEERIPTGARPEKRVPMTRIRTRIAERLLEVTQNTAMLTTFNEINMQHVMELRNRYKEKFEKTHKVRLGFMSFFVKACVEALRRFPVVNASIDGNDIVYHGFYDIGVAVSTERGLIVPVLRDADQMSMAEIEAKIAESAEKARSGKLTLEEMQGGTFTITNGGVFGSLMATPILNSPQCAILGMHKIQERPVVENGQIVIRPMMYVALSYDHRLIDGKESVTFLVTIKELLEDPSRLILEV